MAAAEHEEMSGPLPHPPPPTRRPRRWASRIGLGAGAVVLAAGGTAWLQRGEIAGDLIDDYLAAQGVPATYEIVSIGPQTQVIANLVVGDPARPDLTAERVEVTVAVGWAGPAVSRVRIAGARAYASYREGRFSMGALDPLLFAPSDEPPALPPIDLVLDDARALIASDYGRIGLRMDGAGRLDGGFAGTLAASAPGAGQDGCRAERATLYGALSVIKGAPQLEGPLRLGGIACAGASLARADIGTRLTLSRALDSMDASLALGGAGLGYGGARAQQLGGTARLTWSKSGAALAHDVALTRAAVPQLSAETVRIEGLWRGGRTAGASQWEGEVSGGGLAAGRALGDDLDSAAAGLGDTLLGPLIVRARRGLVAALDDGSFAAEAIVRQAGERLAVTVPSAALRNRGGERVAALSQLTGALTAAGPRLSGNVLIGGPDLPALNARIETRGPGRFAARMAMADYAAGANRIALPRLTAERLPDGTIAFAGLARASGALPSGAVRALEVPLEGRWSARGGLMLGTRCTALRFAGLELADLALGQQAITLCPAGAPAILRWQEGLSLAARLPQPLMLAGRYGAGEPVTLTATSAVLRYPGPFALGGLALALGTGETAVQLAADRIEGTLGTAWSGQFSGGSAILAATPVDLDAIGGRWAFDDGTLTLSDMALRLADRPRGEGEPRFAPLAFDTAQLAIGSETATGSGVLRHPASGRALARVRLSHDLASAAGGAQFELAQLRFDPALQPSDLLPQAEGVIENVSGTITGSGRIDWRGEDALTSSGTFASENIDLAATFGPVRGLSGAVRFTDLLALTTAPDQELAVRSINPGIEVLEGRVRFGLTDGTRIDVGAARWPFMGGTLALRPVALDFSRSEERAYVFEVTGLDAATFIAEMELTNLAATGTYDGLVPIIFDTDGNGRIEGGELVSRSGGGNLSYLGELTYEDLGTMGNYAFAALRSLDYRDMRIGLNGSLGGEIITSFQFDGVRQGAGASKNFVTRRLARLPIRFKVNVRSQNFYQLATMVRSLWDVDYLGNPVDRGLLRLEGGRFVPARPPAQSPVPVQPPESDDLP